MKRSISHAMKIVLLVTLFITFTSYQGQAQFQEVYENTVSVTDNYFHKIIKDGQDYYMLGSENGHATITRTNSSGGHLWTRTLPMSSVWADGIIRSGVSGSAILYVVGYTLPFDNTNSSLIGEITPAGNFICIQSLDVPGNESLTGIDEITAGTYSVVGTQTLPSTSQDVIVLNVSFPGCTINSKHIFNSLAQDNFANDIEMLCNGNALVAGEVNGRAVMYQIGSGQFMGGVQNPVQYTYKDVTETSNCEILAVANPTGSGWPKIMRFDASFLPIWEVSVFGLTTLHQVVEDANGNILAVGTTTISGLPRTVVLKINDSSGTPTLSWGGAKYFGNQATGYTPGEVTPVLGGPFSGRVAYVDGRTGHPSGFGLTDAFLAITDGNLESACTYSIGLDLIIEETLYEGPVAEVLPYDTPNSMMESFLSPEWMQSAGCDTLVMADTCCLDSLAFITAAQNVLVFNTVIDCELTYEIEGLTNCMQMLVDWGDHQIVNIVTGNPATISHTYAGSGSYTVCFTIQELNNGEVCWEYEICETVEVECDTSIFDCGQAVVTCYSGSNPGNYVMAVFDVNDYANQTPLTNWLAPSYHHPDWTASRMGEVFGIAIDATDNIYVTATKVYSSSNASGVVGSAGTGGVYKIDAQSGAVSDFVTTCNIGGPCSSNQLENTPVNGPGLGNICYDQQNNQFFVTNMEDGKIYRIDINGNIVNSFDPFNPASGNPGIEPFGELLWGIGVQTDNIGVRRVYFGVYNNDSSNGGTQNNQIYSIALNASGNFTNANPILEIALPTYSSWNSVVTNPVADIEFSFNGQKMLIAERTMLSSSFAGFQFQSYSHESRVMEFTQLAAGTWNPVPNIFYIGHYNSPKHANAAGGVDYGYKGIDPSTGNVFGCDSMVWASGDALRWESTQRTYGISGIPSSGNAPSPDGINFGPLNSYYIDVDGEVGSADKTYIGDVDIFKCGCPDMTPMSACDSTLIVAPRQIPPLDSCCWTIDLTIQETNICRIEFDIETSGVIFNQFNATNYPILLDASNPNTQISIHNNLSDIPPGFYAGEVDFCLTNILNASQVPQYVVVKYYKCIMETEVLFCKDTLEFACEYPDTNNGCWSSVVDSVYCNPDNSYTIKMTITNEDDTDSYDYLGILNVLPSTCFTLTSPSLTPFTNPLGPGDSEQVCITVNTNKFILDTTNIYFQFYLFSDFACCHAQDSLCIPLPPCCDPCENAIVQVDSFASVFDSCCYTMDVTNGCANNFFKRIETEIITPGVKFSQAQVISALPYVWYTPYGDDTEIHWAPQGGYIPVQSFDNLINFCLTDIIDPSQNPQCVEVRWIACNAAGEDTIFCIDTLKFYCPPIKRDSCIDVLERNVDCLPDGSYQFNYTIQNISTHFASHFSIYNVSPSPPIFINGLGGPGLVNLFPTGTYSGTLNITGGQAGDIVKLKTRLFDFSPPPPGSLFDTTWCCFDTICIVLPPCDTCYCKVPSFTDLILHWDNGPGLSVSCETSYEGIPCPRPGNGYFMTGKFECEGDSCEMNPYVSWELSGPTGLHFNSVQASPYFVINLLPSQTSQNGIYTMSLTSFCGTDTCKCEFQFVVECDTLCPCDSEAIHALSLAVNQGFATIASSTGCTVCFAPVALSDCETVDWHLNNPNGPLLGSSIGNQTFCHSFPGPGTYTVVMVVTRLKPDGTLCESFAKYNTVTVTCVVNPACDGSVLRNSSFSEGAIPGGFNSGGVSEGWTSILKELEVVEGAAGSLDGWTIQLHGNLDTAGILTTIDPVCLARDTGDISFRLRVQETPPCERKGVWIWHRSYQPDSSNPSDWDPDSSLQVANILLGDLDLGVWYDVSVPYDLRDWFPTDSCGEGIMIRPALLVSNVFNSVQGGEDTYTYVQVDNFCMEGMTVAVNNPTQSSGIRIFPNPTTGALNIELPFDAKSGISLQVISLTGQQLLKKTAEPGLAFQTMDASTLPQGMYFLQIVSKGQVIAVNKFVKQ